MLGFKIIFIYDAFYSEHTLFEFNLLCYRRDLDF